MAKKPTVKVKVTGKITRVKPEDEHGNKCLVASKVHKYRVFLDNVQVTFFDKSQGAKAAIRSSYYFLLSPEKALVMANEDGEFPIGIDLTVVGRISHNDRKQLNFVQIVAVDGVDPRAWAERHRSPTVLPEVAEKAEDRVRAQEKAEEDAMRSKAPPEPTPNFKTPREAFDRAMYLVRRQAKLKDPKLTRDDIWQMRDALNTLKEAAGL